MKKEVEYHEISVSFLVAVREAKRVTERSTKSAVRAEMGQLIYAAITGDDIRCMDVEETKIVIDGKLELED